MKSRVPGRSAGAGVRAVAHEPAAAPGRAVAAETARRVIDLRSDTITQPTDAMREAMARAEVGDDVYGEDPTVNALEALSAQRTGKAAAVFVPTGTMANLIAMMAHTEKGDEVILDSEAHTYLHEAGAMTAVAGCHPRPLPTEWGIISPAQFEAALRPPDVHFPPTRVVVIENTHNRHGGTVATAEQIDDLAAAAHRHGIKVHLDGARLFNAAVALGVPASRLAANTDSVTFCVSKALSAPVGSVLCGDADFIARARRFRKMVGGGMRQAGVIAAAGIVALEQMVDRLADDHRVARALAEALAALPGASVDLARVQSNMVRVDLGDRDARQYAGELRNRGVKVGVMSPHRMRLVTNRHVTLDDVPVVIEAFRAVLAL
ncbi:MAG: low-specificity L-threonine aldolase [Armatimonadota bacterium]